MRIRDRALETLGRRREIEHRTHRSELKALDGERAQITERAAAIVRELKQLRDRSLRSRKTFVQIPGPEHVRWLAEQSKAARELSKQKHLCEVNLSSMANRTSILQYSIRLIEKQQQIIQQEQIARRVLRFEQCEEVEIEELVALRSSLPGASSGVGVSSSVVVDSIAPDRDTEALHSRQHIADCSLSGMPTIQGHECGSSGHCTGAPHRASDSDKYRHDRMSNEREHQHAHFTYTDERGNSHDVSIELDEQIQVSVDIYSRGEASDVAYSKERLRHSLMNAGISVTDVSITQES